MNHISLFKLATLSLLACAPALAQDKPANAQPAGHGVYTLDSFGPFSTPKEANETYAAAVKAIEAAGGGVLTIPATAPKGWNFSNSTQRVQKTPAPPASTKSWSYSPGVTVVDLRGGSVDLKVPQITGFNLSRTFALPEGESAGHWDYYPMLSLNNNVVRGSTSYLDWVQADVEPGKDRRFYVPTIRGIFPGMFLNAHERDGYAGGVERLFVKELGYDTEKKMSYFLADADIPHKTGAIVHNKTHVNVARLTTRAHTELQTFDMLNERYHYSQGDSYLYDATFRYMGNVHSAAGDENGVLYAAFVYGQGDIFQGSVESAGGDAADAVVFARDAKNPHTLGTGRPLINLNPEKWITGGSAVVVRPGNFIHTTEEDPTIKDPVYKGKSYPTQIIKNPFTGIKQLSMGGLIEGSADAPWTQEVVGRYFAIDEKDELVPNGSRRRWYLITSFKANPDGSKEIRIERQWWGAKSAGAPTLYQDENYSCDGHVKPMKYIIAPGSNVYDVSKGVLNYDTKQPYDGGQWERKLLVAPFADRGTKFNFAPGDAVEQAIGSDPFKPIPFRAWTFDQVPGPFPAPIFDVANQGPVPRATVLSVKGGKPGKPAWDSIISVNSSTQNVLEFGGEITGAAILVSQKSRSVPIQWKYDEGRKEANLAVDTKTGRLTFDGGALSANGGFSTVGGLSGTQTEARNLRGVGVSVPEGVTSFFVKFPKAEDDAEYAVFLETSWLGRRAITEQKPDGFTVTFSDKTPASAKLHWLLVR